MNKKCLILAIISIIVVAIELIFFVPKKDSNSTIYIEINPSIEIEIDKDENVVKVNALNDDAKEIINEDFKGKALNELFEKLLDNLIDKGYVSDNNITMLIHVSDNLESEDIGNRIRGIFSKKDIYADTILIDEVSKEDEEFAKEHGISPYKAAFLNAIKENNEEINIEELIDKPIKELEETRLTGNTCEEGYFLEGDHCLKEIERIEAKQGNICPRNYNEYNGKCYRETNFIDGENYVCEEGFTLTDGVCYRKEVHPAEGKCNNDGHYDGDKDVCHEFVYIGDATEFCRDPGRTLYDHKCLATKPTINGGCLNGDMLYNGKCVNTRNDYYASEWRCPNGQMNSSDKGDLLFPDNRCLEEKTVAPSSYVCNDDFVLDGKACIKEETKKAYKERICPSGYTKTEFDRCYDFSDSKEFELGLVCDKENARVEDNVCVVYEIVEAKHNKKEA